MKFFKIILILLLMGGICALLLYQKITNPNLQLNKVDDFFYVKSDMNSDSILSHLKYDNWVKDKQALEWTAKVMRFSQSKTRPGRYRFDSLSSSKTILGKIRIGAQEPVSLIINNVRTYQDLAGKVSQQLELDSLIFLKAIENKYPNEENRLCVFIPDTYKVYWTSSAEKILKRLEKENNLFWSKHNRSIKAKKLGLSKEEVYTLASIVEKETNYNEEKKRVAGVYLNRLKKGMLLQADPTVVFANQKFDLKRVLNKHLAIDSPYNTYMYAGLPPGPIYMPSKSSIDAVLNAEDHDYLYFCAKADNSGQHAFAKSLKGHNHNAQKYRKWLSNNGF